MKPVLIHPAAYGELDKAAAYYAADNRLVSSAFLTAINRAISLIADFPALEASFSTLASSPFPGEGLLKLRQLRGRPTLVGHRGLDSDTIQMGWASVRSSSVANLY